MARGRKKTAPDNFEEWKLRSEKVKALRKSRGFFTVAKLLESKFWEPLKKFPGLGDAAYYKYERAALCFQDGQLDKIAKHYKIKPELLIDPEFTLKEFLEIIKWRWSFVNGSAYSLQSGIASTVSQKNGCHEGWFRGETTVIVGAGEASGCKNVKTRVNWNINTDFCALEKFQVGYLFIGCVRRLGGLHSGKFGAQVDILLNENPIDNFSLMLTPEGHTDYFHRPAIPDLPTIKPISSCETQYTWTIQKCELLENAQTVTVVIENKISWDIDYVGFLWMEDLV